MLVICNQTPAQPSEDDSEVEVLGHGTYARLQESVQPNLPKAAALRKVEGWVRLSFSVDPEGNPADVRVVDASIEKVFESSAIGALKRWKYFPATSDGEPTTQFNVSADMLFRLKAGKGAISRSFQRQFDNVWDDLKERNLDSARATIDRLGTQQQAMLVEVCLLDFLESSYWRLSEDVEKALHHIERALVCSDEIVGKGLYEIMLSQAVNLYAELGYYAAVLSTSRKALELNPELSKDHPIQMTANAVERAIEGPEILLTEGEIKECYGCDGGGNWLYQLVRHRFEFRNVEGTIDELELLCGIRSTSLLYETGLTWNIDSGWRDCWLRLYGNPGTTFELLQMGESQKTGVH